MAKKKTKVEEEQPKEEIKAQTKPISPIYTKSVSIVPHFRGICPNC